MSCSASPASTIQDGAFGDKRTKKALFKNDAPF
jgi:hypothetical protein